MQSKDFFPWSTEKILTGEVLAISKLSDLPPEASRDQESFRKYGTKATVLVPLLGGGDVIGVLSFAMMREERDWSELLVKRIHLVAQVFANALIRKKVNEKLLCAFSEIKRLKELLEAENVYLREDIKMELNFDEIVGQSDALRYILFRVEQVAGTMYGPYPGRDREEREWLLMLFMTGARARTGP
jgi:transcriptional regulator with GAF, ATPase, and Fis domain